MLRELGVSSHTLVPARLMMTLLNALLGMHGLMMTLLKALLVASMSFIAAEIYASLAWTYHWDYPPNWLGDLLKADGESYYDTMDLTLHIYVQALGFVIWGVLRWLGKG